MAIRADPNVRAANALLLSPQNGSEQTARINPGRGAWRWLVVVGFVALVVGLNCFVSGELAALVLLVGIGLGACRIPSMRLMVVVALFPFGLGVVLWIGLAAAPGDHRYDLNDAFAFFVPILLIVIVGAIGMLLRRFLRWCGMS